MYIPPTITYSNKKIINRQKNRLHKKVRYLANLFNASLAACCSALFFEEPTPTPNTISSILTAISNTGLFDGPDDEIRS